MLIEQISTEQHGMFVRRMNHDRVPWSITDNLIADLWLVTVRANSDPEDVPDDYDHPVRYAMGEPERVERQRELRAKFEERKRRYAKQKQTEG
ncbi:MAG TPA: hypothetical protein PKG94_14285 [Gordonia sp. (in: high G+C Gram-positive bacteria)]|nr:hypothetical protein [Gordonia sp. (in: high G+C Gram-positive bacteria)]